jgi:hypothetical protein
MGEFDPQQEIGTVIIESIEEGESEVIEEPDTDVCEIINECARVDFLVCDDELKINEGLCLRTINELYECLDEHGCMKPCECYLNNYYMQCKPFTR